MALSGNQVTSLAPYGGSMGQYGSFAGKDEQEIIVIIGGLAAVFLSYAWPWHTWKVH